MTKPAPVEVRPVQSRGDWRAFMALPGQVFRDDPCWVRPLDWEVRALWSRRNPWFGHARAQAWLAWRGGQAVGSISGQVDARHRETTGKSIGYFGQLCAVDDAAVFEALFAEVRRWLVAHGCHEMRGPFDLGINQSCGLLVDGFDSPPMIRMNHGAPWFGVQVEACGLDPAMDLLAYTVSPGFEAPRAMKRLVERAGERLRIRPLNWLRYRQEFEVLRELFNDAWADNWGFVPASSEEFQHMGREMRLIIGPKSIHIAELDGEPVGFIVALPNINELVSDLNGKLFPLGWLTFLWRLKTRKATSARVPLMGIRRQLHGQTLGAMVGYSLVDAMRWPLVGAGIQQMESSWILETNQGVRSILESIGARVYKRYRIYQANLGPSEIAPNEITWDARGSHPSG
jgi:hypothetical protein